MSEYILNESQIDEFLKETYVSEQQLHESLKSWAGSGNDEGPAVETVVNYVLHQMVKSGERIISDEKINEEASLLLTGHILHNMVQKDLLDVDFSEDTPKYRLSEFGKQLADELKDDKED